MAKKITVFKVLRCILGHRLYCVLLFVLYQKRFPNLLNPQKMNDRLLKRKIIYSNEEFPLYSMLSDKIAVRDYVLSCVGDNILIPLLFTGDSVTVEDLTAIKRPFVCKSNHDSGSVFIVNHKTEISELEVIARELNSSLRNDYGRLYGESWYSEIEPKILAEEFIGNDFGPPEDYKIHAFEDSQQIVIQVDFDRSVSHTRSFYDETGTLLNYELKYKKKAVTFCEPDMLKVLKDYALKLVAGLGYARVDFYIVNGRVFFGEITLAHGSGLERFNPPEIDGVWGQYWAKSIDS